MRELQNSQGSRTSSLAGDARPPRSFLKTNNNNNYHLQKLDQSKDTCVVCLNAALEPQQHCTHLGSAFSRPALVEAMVRGGAEAWEAFTSFCKAVMLVKEEAQRERERLQSSVSIVLRVQLT